MKRYCLREIMVGLILLVPGTASKAQTGALNDLSTLGISATHRSNGFFNIYELTGHYYFEIPDSILGRDLLIVNRIAKGPVGINHGDYGASEGQGFAHDEVGRFIIRFEKAPGNKLFLRKISNSIEGPAESEPFYDLVQRSNMQPVMASFDIKPAGVKADAVTIELTDYITGDDNLFSISNDLKTELTIGSYQPDKSYVISVAAYPDNIHIRSFKTFAATAPNGYASFELSSSIVLLPKEPMHPRYADPRLNYYTDSFLRFGSDLQQGLKSRAVIMRYRLEPRKEDMEKFSRGELVEPQKPIVFYIDPDIPEKWISYFIQGVNEWQKAFEKIGFKNAIIGKKAPSSWEDSTWSMDDARFSVIYYKPSQSSNANASDICDPRSGEIIEAHVYVDHNLWVSMHDMYMVLASPSDPRARKAHFDDELMGRIIRYDVAHEVGHALGLTHNMEASDATPVEKLRDKAYVEKYDLASSIMDYARFNYVAQPEDSMGTLDMIPRVNDYDEWSIEWGYKPIFGKTEEQEKTILNKWILDHHSDPRLRFHVEDQIDPRVLDECLGDDLIKANTYGIKNLQWVLPQLPVWLGAEGKGFEDLERVYRLFLDIYSEHVGQPGFYIGGIYTDLKVSGQGGRAHFIVPKIKQKEALSFIQQQLFLTPYWLLNRNILDKLPHSVEDIVSKIQDDELQSLLDPVRLLRMIASFNQDASAYRIDDYMADLTNGVWSELTSLKPIDNYRRNLQKIFVEKLSSLINPASIPGQGSAGTPKGSDISSVARGLLLGLKVKIRAALPGEKDRLDRYHLQDMLQRIDKALQ